MKKLTTLLAFLLSACLLCCTAAAEAYIPGAASEALVADVLGSGKLLHGDVRLRLDMDGTVLGLSEEEQQILDLVCSVLDSVTLGVGAGMTEDGVRIELDAELASAQGTEPVAVNAAVNVNLTGVSLESDLIEGQKVTAKWETLLAMAGLNDSDIMMIMSLRDTDWETLLPQLIATAEQYLQIAAQMLTPYGETLISWAAGLPVEIIEDIEPLEGYPTAASELVVTVTEKNVGELITLLSEQVKADTTLCSLMDLVLQEAYTGEEAAPTTAQLCDEVIAEAAAMTGEDEPLLLVLGTDAEGTPLYGQAYAMSGESVLAFADVVAALNAEGACDYALSFLSFDSEGNLYDGLAFSGVIGADTFTLLSEAYASGVQVMGFDYGITWGDIQSELPAMTLEQSMNMVADDGGETVQMVMSGNAQCALTADGGEVIDDTITMDIYADGMTVTLTALETLSLFPTEDGLSGSYGITQSAPAIGLDSAGFDVLLSTESYDPAATAALSEFTLETASGEDIDMLLSTVMSVGQVKLLEALQALPEELFTLLMGG